MTRKKSAPADTDTSAAPAPAGLSTRVEQAATAAAGLMPAAVPLTVGPPRAAGELDGEGWTHGALAPLTPGDAQVGVLVGTDLADALATAPEEPLDLGAAVQPALDAAATALGASAGPARAVTGDELDAVLAQATSVVPLSAGSEVSAVLFVVEQTAGAPVTDLGQVADRARSRVASRGVEMLHGVAMEVTVELGRTTMSVRELLQLSPGDVLELDRAAGSPADLLVNGRLIAHGEVVVVDEDFALRVTEIVAPSAAG
ncbi:MAG TPA: flagellar motor switch protein FliN [Nocardioidaceae bacterium]|nr:flagellar motor switch protein FliN [Nocardioidaceae bacterium]